MSQPSDIDIAALPKVELHLHLEGALRPETVRDLAARNGAIRADDSDWAALPGAYAGLPEFVATAKRVMDACLRGPADYERIGYEVFADLARQNVLYAEVSFGWGRARKLGIPFDDLLAALDSARRQAAQSWGIRVGLIVALSRETDARAAAEVVGLAAGARDRGVAGIDLHGNEAGAPASAFASAFVAARGAGLGLRAHAGEGLGADSVWRVLHDLGVDRIAHGVRAIEDPALLDCLRERGVTLDVCPTSNVRLGVVPSLREHPLRRLFDHGLRVTVNSDDPLFFGTTISRELELVHREQGFTRDELQRITLYAADAAFLPADERARLRDEIEEGYATGRAAGAGGQAQAGSSDNESNRLKAFT